MHQIRFTQCLNRCSNQGTQVLQVLQADNLVGAVHIPVWHADQTTDGTTALDLNSPSISTTPARHTLTLTVKGNTIKGAVNGKHYLTSRLPEPVSGRVGVWTKADSVVYFDDYTVIR